jgi:hypothetical protein
MFHVEDFVFKFLYRLNMDTNTQKLSSTTKGINFNKYEEYPAKPAPSIFKILYAALSDFITFKICNRNARSKRDTPAVPMMSRGSILVVSF